MTSQLLYKFTLACIAYFSPISSLIYVVLGFIFIDFLTGIYASRKRKEIIVSNRLRKTLEKFVFYSLAIIVAHIFQLEIMNWLNLTNIVAGFIASIELISIYENIKSITGLNLVVIVKDYIMNAIKTMKK